jgi:hypothetical protein
MTQVICIWEAPRSRGTSISYALYHGLKSAGYNCLYRDEPLYPRRLQQIEKDEGPVVRQRYIENVKAPDITGVDFIVQKDQAKWLFDERTSHWVGNDLSWTKKFTNIILFRDAHETVVSHLKKISPNLDLQDSNFTFERIGIAQLSALQTYLGNSHSLAVDSNALLANPENGMRKLCAAIGAPYSPGMIKWDKPEIETPLWGEHWYDDLMGSRGLHAYRAGNRAPVVPALAELIAQTDKVMNGLRPYCINFDGPERNGHSLFLPRCATPAPSV